MSTSPGFASLRRPRLRLSRHLAHTGLLAGGAILALALVVAIFAPWIAPYDPYAQNLPNRFVPPVWFEGGTWAHVLGTDHLGRDYLSRIMFGTRVSLTIAFSCAAIACVIGSTLGVIAGYFGGIADRIVSFIITVRLAMPVVLVALAVVGLVGNSLMIVILVLGLLLWDQFAIVMRTAVRRVRNAEYIAAASAIGASHWRIILTEVLPNTMNVLLVILSLEMAHAVLLEAALSFLGLGVQPPMPSWGLMVSEGKDYIFFSPWVIAIPGAAIFILVLAINFVGDGLRDVMSPQERRD